MTFCFLFVHGGSSRASDPRRVRDHSTLPPAFSIFSLADLDAGIPWTVNADFASPSPKIFTGARGFLIIPASARTVLFMIPLFANRESAPTFITKGASLFGLFFTPRSLGKREISSRSAVGLILWPA